MARSSYIFVVIDLMDDSVPHSTFTVKHEMITMLRKLGSPNAVRILRYPDGRAGVPLDVTSQIILGEGPGLPC